MMCHLPLTDLAVLLRGLQRLVNEKAVHQGAGLILLEADDETNKLTISANNGKMVVKRSIEATVGIAGSVVLPMDTISRWVLVAGEWIDPATVVYVTDKDVGMSGHVLELFLEHEGKHTATFATRGSDEFSNFTIPEIDTLTILSHALLTEEIAHVTWAGSHVDDGVGRLGGANLHINPSDRSVSLVAADGFRMARTSIEQPNGTVGDESFLLPLSSLDALPTLLWVDENVTIIGMGLDASRSRVYFWSGSTTVGVSVMAITYPDIDALLRRFSAPRVTVTINREAMASFAKRIARYAVTTAKGGMLSPSVTIYAGPAEDWTVTVASKVGTLNEKAFDQDPLVTGREIIPCRDVVGDVEVELKCNAIYLSDALQSTTEDEIIMEFRTDREPISFRSLLADKSWASYVMPMGRNQ
jgi:DNA polymerase III sliding clamp (beta) subunit (PCNA family)